jgi:hypothetical protein
MKRFRLKAKGSGDERLRLRISWVSNTAAHPPSKKAPAA